MQDILGSKFIICIRLTWAKVCYFSIFCIHLKPVFLSTHGVLSEWMHSFFGETPSRYWYQPLLGRKATNAPSAASETADQPYFTLSTGQKTGWASVSFKLKPVTGMLSLPVISVVRSQSEDFLSSILIILVSVTSETPISSFAVHPLTRWNFSYFGFCQKAF